MEIRIWHDEAQRWEQTGRLDEGPCWCADCIAAELGNPATGKETE